MDVDMALSCMDGLQTEVLPYWLAMGTMAWNWGGFSGKTYTSNNCCDVPLTYR